MAGSKKVPIRTPEGPEHYAFVGEKHLIPKSVYHTHFRNWSCVHQVNDEWLDAIPRGRDLPSKSVMFEEARTKQQIERRFRADAERRAKAEARAEELGEEIESDDEEEDWEEDEEEWEELEDKQ